MKKVDLRVKHNHSKRVGASKTYRSWAATKARCTNPNSDNYKYYGGKGIKMCSRWLDSFENFLEDMGERPTDMTLERKDGKGDYCPENCIWANQSSQIRNSSLCKLNVESVRKIKLLIGGGMQLKEIAFIFSVTPENISAIKRGITWRNV